MSDYRRRRFLTDLLFVGGALLAAAGLASTGGAQTHSPSASPSTTPKCSNTQLPMPGEPVAVPSVTASPQNYPPAGAPPPVNYNPKPTPRPNKPKKPH
jgi:hypothetical protein